MSAQADNPELEALFDSIVAETISAGGETTPASAAANAAPPGNEPEELIAHVGQLTRKLHDTLRELGHDRTLVEAADSIPDARDRLSYVAQLTENAAQRVLSATERAQPLQEQLAADAGALEQRWATVFDGQTTDPQAFRSLAEDTRAFLGMVATHTAATRTELLEIVMAQDFQDLTGQVIKRMTEVTAELERKLLAILLEHAPAASSHSDSLQGPAYNERMRSSTLNDQVEVDALLESMGF